MFCATLSACDVIQFQQQTLYSSYEKQDAEKLPEAVIFSDGVGTMWNSLFSCGTFKVTKELAYQGNSCISVSWDKSKGCQWIGFGNSFSNWAAVDLSKERHHKALTFYVRTQEKTSGSLPIVAALEDFGGGGSYHFIDTKKYLKGLCIDTTWKQVIVPLWDFPINEEQVDITSIKQMQFQLEGGGSFYLDEIKIIDYSPEKYQSFRAEVEAMKPRGKTNQNIYNPQSFEFDIWGQREHQCHTLAQKNNHIHWRFNASQCSWAKWGINWNNWYPINLRGLSNQVVLEIELTTQGKTNFTVSLEDFSSKRLVLLEHKASTEESGIKRTIRASLKETGITGIQLDQIKQLLFEGSGIGDVEISSIKLLPL